MCALKEVQVESLGRSPTFVVGSKEQGSKLDALQKREQHLSESYQKNKPLCFSARSYQKTHPRKAAQGYKDADATLISPMLVSVADGVSQIEEFGIDASKLPHELLAAVEELAVAQLLPDDAGKRYAGPISMLRQAYESTQSLGSTTVLMAAMDNSTRIHGKLHPMIAVLSIGDCELMIFRRGKDARLTQMFHTEMQRIGGHAQAPLQLARVDENIDPEFDEGMALEVIERGSAVQCVSAYEGDIVILGSDGVFDNLYDDEILAILEEMLPTQYPYGKFAAADRDLLGRIAKRIVKDSHAKTQARPDGSFLDAPIGRGGKIDDTSCVVGEVVEWTPDHTDAWTRVRRQRKIQNFFSCGMGGPGRACESDSDEEYRVSRQQYPSNPNGSFSDYGGSFASLASGFDGGSFSEFGGSFVTPQGKRGSRGEFGDDEASEAGEADGQQCTVM